MPADHASASAKETLAASNKRLRVCGINEHSSTWCHNARLAVGMIRGKSLQIDIAKTSVLNGDVPVFVGLGMQQKECRPWPPKYSLSGMPVMRR